MAAEGLPTGTPVGALPGWELEGWYQDLQEVLEAAAEPSGPSLPWGAEQVEVAPLWGTEGSGSGLEGCELDTALAAELLELLGPENTAGMEPAGPKALGSASSSSPRAHLGVQEDEGEAAAGRGVKRKRCSRMGASRELAKHREQANEQRVVELTAHNERLREEIQRLSTEVERTRAALIDHIVNLQRVTPADLGGGHELEGRCTTGTD